MEKLNIVVLCGGKSVESDISLITGTQAFLALDEQKYNRFLVFIDQKNKWWLCDNVKAAKDILKCKKEQVCLLSGERTLLKCKKNKLKPLFNIDAVVMALHGGYGENGTIAGLLEMSGIAYTSSNVYASAVAMNKILTKLTLIGAKIKTIDYQIITKYNYFLNQNEEVDKVVEKLGFPCIVKPACLGSSIGIKKANNEDELKQALNSAFDFDNNILVEKYLQNFYELNVGVKKQNGEIVTSEIEKPIKNDEILSFCDKYLKNSKGTKKCDVQSSGKGMVNLQRELPAKIDDAIRQKVIKLSKQVYQLLDMSGIVRIDFLVKDKTVYVNEINSIPGSLSYYLFTGQNLSNIIDEEINLAIKTLLLNEDLITCFDSSIFV